VFAFAAISVIVLAMQLIGRRRVLQHRATRPAELR
jgi:hypothetical protein